MRYLSALTTAALLSSVLPALGGPAASLVQNGDFESGSLGPWTVAGDASGLSVSQSPTLAHTGDWFAVFGSQGASTLSQVVGGTFQSYDLNFWAEGAGFSVLWDGNQVASDVGGASGWQNYDLLLPGQASKRHTLAFTNLGLPATFGYIPRLDTVSLSGVVTPAQVPEPPAIMLLGIGLIGLTGALYRKKSRARGLPPTGSLDPSVIRDRLRQEEALLHRAGVERLSLVGSAARGTMTTISDVDVVATFRNGLKLRSLRDLVKLSILERHLSHAVKRSVDVLPAHTLDARMLQTTGRDAVRVF